MSELTTDGVLRATDDPYRHDAFLPAPTPQSHAANLMPLPSGALGCAWFGGTQEGLPDITIWFSRLGSDGVWSEPVRVSSDPHRSEQNPVLFPLPNGALWLLYTAQHAGDQDTAEVRVTSSTDEGRTWSAARTLIPASEECGVFVRQPVVVLESGRWLLPVFHCVRPTAGRWRGDHDTSAVLVSDDQGATWHHHDVPHSTGCVHMNVVPLTDGTVLALFRRRQADAIYESRSSDGVHWSAPAPTELPNNNSSIQATALHDGRLALVFNASSAEDATARRASLYDEIDGDSITEPSASEEPAGAAFWGAPRAPMTLALSSDNGHTWPVRRDLEVGDGYCLTNNSRDGLNRELSYPSITQAADGDLHIAFTYFRQAIKHVRIAPDWAGL
ncbi:putative neuraminidase [Halopolyspora algeriensis]|uniref:Putative neuraminidase n=1 Tax=Halopolyspora algeriensis TaxID=1500506 RepID=A0A368VII1_9ACTN|nr:exo-alpha-sialidase [Halopolyspora algeriensis]RCW41067.1 putative neuraminidase [Halopolyspora algeriensis]TQM53849.1 putative neuraminidase [Halopolyspora algeriensis]